MANERSNIATRNIPLKACTACTDSKQKCDKHMPTCSRCERLLHKCHYPAEVGLFRVAGGASRKVPDQATNGHKDDLARTLQSLCNEYQPCVKQIAKLIWERKELIDGMVETFFETYHYRLPIIDRQFFLDRWNSAKSNASPCLSALCLSICLLTQPNVEEGGKPDVLARSLYCASKCLFWNLASATQPSLPVMQAGILMSVYECGQGMTSSAHMTISTCAAMARLCSISENWMLPFQPAGLQTELDEDMKACWGIIIIERVIGLQGGLPIQSLGSAETIDHALFSPEVDSKVCAQSAAGQLDQSFLLQLKGAILLEQVLKLDFSGFGDRFEVLSRYSLWFLNKIFDQETRRLGSCCEAMALGTSAFLLLHQKQKHRHDPCLSAQDRLVSSIAIEKLIKIVCDMVREHLVTAACVEYKGRHSDQSPYAIHMIFQCAAAIPELCQRLTSGVDQEVFIEYLRRQSHKWKISGAYVDILRQSER